MNILVTGGIGFIGTNYIRYILSETDHEIINVDAITYAGNPKNLCDLDGNSKYTFVHGDITDKKLIDEVMGEVDWVVHFAAESHVDRSIENSLLFAQTNVMGTLTLLDAALKHGVGRFHHISTDEVFGSLGELGKFSEDTKYDPRSPYAASKASSDHFVRAYHHTHGLPITISNCSNNFGPYQHPEKFIPRSITNLLQGKPIVLYGDGKNVRDWIHVHDHVLGIQNVVEEGIAGETYCFGGESEYSNIEIAEKIIEIMNIDLPVEFVADRKGHDFRYAIDNTKVKHDFSWQPTLSFEKRLRETVDWYIEHEEWWRPSVI